MNCTRAASTSSGDGSGAAALTKTAGVRVYAVQRAQLAAALHAVAAGHVHVQHEGVHLARAGGSPGQQRVARAEAQHAEALVLQPGTDQLRVQLVIVGEGKRGIVRHRRESIGVHAR